MKAACSLELNQGAIYRALARPAKRQRRNSDFMGEAWLDLADRIAERIKKWCRTVDHPLVEKVLGPRWPRVD
jgi:hypothetical protein